jgi:hypothetical protein
MHQHKAIARISLFLSIISFTFAGVALAQTPMMHEMGVDPVTSMEADEELDERSGRPPTTGHLHSRLDDIVVPAAENLDENKFFSKEMIRKIKEYLVLGTVYGIFVGISNGAQKEIAGTVAPGAYVFTSSRYPCCHSVKLRILQTYSDCPYISLSQTVGRRSVKPLEEQPQYQEDAMSGSLSNMRDQDLKMLSVLSRRMLNTID